MSIDLPPGFGPNDPTAFDRAETDYSTCGFTVKEHAPRGTPPQADPWIMVETDSLGLKVLRAGDAFLGLECREGVTLEEASGLAHEMHRLLVGITCTKFIT